MVQLCHGPVILYEDTCGHSSRGYTNGYAAAELIDPDGDGAWNWEEYFAGTDPTNRASVFSILKTGQTAGNPWLQWYATTNSGATNRFMVHRCTNLVAGAWQLAASNIDPQDLSRLGVLLSSKLRLFGYSID